MKGTRYIEKLMVIVLLITMALGCGRESEDSDDNGVLGGLLPEDKGPIVTIHTKEEKVTYGTPPDSLVTETAIEVYLVASKPLSMEKEIRVPFEFTEFLPNGEEVKQADGVKFWSTRKMPAGETVSPVDFTSFLTAREAYEKGAKIVLRVLTPEEARKWKPERDIPPYQPGPPLTIHF